MSSTMWCAKSRRVKVAGTGERATGNARWEAAGVGNELIQKVAELLRERNAIDASIAQIIGRPVASGHLGEWVASQIFDIDLEESASAAGIDGRFRVGLLEGRTVNIKWYMKHQGLLDATESMALEYYLILAGPPPPAGSSRGSMRPWCIRSVYLFDARQLRAEQDARGAKRGIASSVTKEQWDLPTDGHEESYGDHHRE
jgi:hypothetical protein